MAEKNIKSGLLAAVALLAEQGNSTTLEKFAVAVIAETIFFNEWSSIDKGAKISASTKVEISLKKIAKLIQSKCDENQKQYKALKGYNRESLYLLIEKEWGKFDYEQCLISLDWAYEYDKQNGLVKFDGFIEKKRREEMDGREYKIDVPSCGNREYCIANDDNVVGVEQIVQQGNNVSTTTKSGEVKAKLDSIYKKLVEKRGGDNCINNFEYIWQWKITTDEYDEIKKLLESDDCKNCINNIYETNVNYYFIIVAYVAERYKREWNGNDGEDNALRQIGLDGKVGKISKKYFGSELGKIYSPQNNNRIYREMLDSLRMEGGLPINYINKASEGDRTQNNLVKFTECLYEDVQRAIEFLTEKINNSVIKHSYEKGYSLKKYIDTLLEGGLESVCCVDSDVFQEFKKLLENGRDNARGKSKKFAYKYRIWKWDSQKEFLLHQSVVLKQDTSFGETQELISRERIKQWDFELEENDVFWLEIGGVRYEFQPWKKEFYRSVNGFTEFPLPTTKFPDCNLVLEPIYFVNQKGEKKKINSIVKDNKSYIKFTSDNSYDWETGKSGELSAVLLLPKAKVELEHSEEICDVGSKLRWVEFSDRIKIDGKHVYSGKFNVHPKDEAVHPISKCKYIRSITYRKDDENHFIYLLNSSKIESKNFTLVNEDGQEIKFKSKVKYLDNETSKWKDCPKNLSGLVRLDFEGQRIDAYILPHNASVNRELEEDKGKIIFTNIRENVVVEGYKIIKNDNSRQIKDKYADDNQYRDNIIVDINVADNEFISFDIIRPLKRTDKKFNGRIVPSNQNVPKKLQSQYKLRKFDKNGVRYIEDRNSECLYSNNRIIKHTQGFYYIAEGVNPTIENNLEFVFILNEGYREIDLTISEKTITESGKDKKYICLENVPTEKGVIIQTLRNKMPEMTYYEPLWCGGSNKFVFAQENSHNKTSLVRLKLSVKHKLYFKELMYCGVNEERYEITPKLLVYFFEDYYKNHDAYDWSALWDMLFELNKDWMSIPRNVWNEFATDEEKKKLVCDLFKNRPNTDSEVFDKFVDNYWDLKWRRIGQGGKSNAYTFMQNIFGSVNEFYEVPNMDEKFNKELDRLLND